MHIEDYFNFQNRGAVVLYVLTPQQNHKLKMVCKQFCQDPGVLLGPCSPEDINPDQTSL